MPAAPAFKLPAYKLTQCAVPKHVEPHQVPIAQLAPIVNAIVLQEGPIHEDEIARRVASLFGKERAGARIIDVTMRALNTTHAKPIQRDDKFWMTPEQSSNPAVRDRSSAPPSVLRAEMLPPSEIRAARGIAEEQNGSLSDEEMPVAIARLLGFQRTGPELRAVIVKALAMQSR